MDEVICDETAHVYRYEGGGIAFNSSASVRLLYGDRGRLTADLIEPHVNPDNIHYPKSTLVVLENTVNRGGGSIYTLEDMEPVFLMLWKKQKTIPKSMEECLMGFPFVYLKD